MSNESEILAALDVLRQDVIMRQSRIDQMNALIRFWESELKPDNGGISEDNQKGTPMSLPSNSGGVVSSVSSEDTVQEKYPQFPRDKHPTYQLLYVLGQIGIATRLSVLESEINLALKGKARFTEHQSRASINNLLEDGKVARIKFNKTKKLFFYVLPDWIETDEQGDKKLKEAYMPTDEDLPNGYHTIEFL